MSSVLLKKLGRLAVLVALTTPHSAFCAQLRLTPVEPPAALPAALPALPAGLPAIPLIAPFSAAPEKPAEILAGASAEKEAFAGQARFDGALNPPDATEAVPVEAASNIPALRYAAGLAAASLSDPGPRTASIPDRVRDRFRYTRLLTSNFWWYMYTHIGDMWPGYKARLAKAKAEGPVAVSRPRAFFSAMRVAGMSGRFYVLGGSALDDDLVIREFRRAFTRYFDGPGIGDVQRDAFEAFMQRAKSFNAERRAHTNMYKNIRDPLIKASVMRPEELAPYFNSLMPPEKEISTKDYQESGEMQRTLDRFLIVLRETLDEEDRDDPYRVRAAIVLGSFASGSAGPSSDFDVEALVKDARGDRLEAFTRRLTARWTSTGLHKFNPVTVHTYASWPSWGLVNIVQTRHYIVVSPDQALAVRLSRQAFEDPSVQLERGYTLRGRVNRVVQRAIVAAATYISDAQAALGVKRDPPAH